MKSRFPRPAGSKGAKSAFGRYAVVCAFAAAFAAGAVSYAKETSSSAKTYQYAGVDQRLSRGVNISHWFAQSEAGYDSERLSSYVSKAELARLRSAGFTHVRLPVAMEWSFQDSAASQAYRSKLKEKVSEINAAGMAAVVDIHPDEAEKGTLLESGRDSFFVEGWRRLAGSFSDLNHRLVLFEIMNEPHPLAGARWSELQAKAIDAIRSVAPHNTIIANPGGWSSIDDFDLFAPHPHSNLIYTAHIYEPLLFTHQGAAWTWEIAAQVSDVGWPLPAGLAEDRAKRAGLTDEAVKHLHFQIANGQFEVDWLLRRFDKLAQWQQRFGNPPIYIGEFGVYQKATPKDARLQWHEVTRKAFEDRKWGWAVWDYSGGYGIAQPSGNPRAFDGAMLKTLGLQNP